MQRQSTLPVTLIFLVQMEFNKSFRQVLERQHRIRWPIFERLRRDHATRNVQPENIALLGAFTPQIPAPLDPTVLSGTPTVGPAPEQTKTQSRPQQITAQKPWTASHLYVALVFRHCRTIDITSEGGGGNPPHG